MLALTLIGSALLIFVIGKPIVETIDDYMKNHNVEEDIDE